MTERKHALSDFYQNGRVVDNDAFLRNILPLDERIVEAVFVKVCEEGFYDKDKRCWPSLPFQGKADSNVTALLNEIRYTTLDIAKKAASFPAEYPDNQSVFVDIHARSPKDAPSIRPDVVLATKDPALIDLFEQVQELEECLSLLQTKLAKEKEAMESVRNGKKRLRFLQEEKEELMGRLEDMTRRISPFWMHVHAIGELRVDLEPESDVDVELEAIIQLLINIRQVFREQLDRRFVIGFTLCRPGDMLRIFCCDRSGVLGMESACSIHENPRVLIRLVASLVTMRPEEIGWDPTMMIFRGLREEPLPSYARAYRELCLCRTHWRIQVGERVFVTLRALSIVKADCIEGNAEIVWEVFELVGGDLSPKVRVLKQQWRPAGAVAESELYSSYIPDGPNRSFVGNTICAEDCFIGGSLDHTLELIRHGLKGEPVKNQQHLTVSREERRELKLLTRTIDRREIGKETSEPIYRVKNRLVLSEYGWQIWMARDSVELLRIVRDVVKGMKHLYEAGILWRDPNLGNILICPQEGEEDTYGCIIDLHVSQRSDSSELVESGTTESEHVDSLFDEGHMALVKYELRCDVDVSTVHCAKFWLDKGDHTQKRSSGAKDYICEVHRIRGKPGPVSPRSLGWESFEQHPRPCVESFPPGKLMSGTLPFISSELVSSTYTLQRTTSTTGQRIIYHDTIHDLHALFHVVLYIVLTRGEGGGKRRVELDQENETDSDEGRRLKQLVYYLFEVPDRVSLAHNKHALLQSPANFATDVLPLIHPFWNDTKDVLEEWFWILFLALKWRAVEYYHPHVAVLNALEPKIAQLVGDGLGRGGNAAPSTLGEVERRRADLERIKTGWEMLRTLVVGGDCSGRNTAEGSRGEWDEELICLRLSPRKPTEDASSSKRSKTN